MSGYAMEWAIEAGEAKGLSPDARIVLVAVAYFAHPRDGMAWNASRAEVMAKTALGHHRVIRAVAELEAAEVIGMDRRRRGIAWGPFPVLVGAARPGDKPAAARTDARFTANVTRGRARVGRADGRATAARTGARNHQGVDHLRAGAHARPDTWQPDLGPCPNLSDLPEHD